MSLYSKPSASLILIPVCIIRATSACSCLSCVLLASRIRYARTSVLSAGFGSVFARFGLVMPSMLLRSVRWRLCSHAPSWLIVLIRLFTVLAECRCAIICFAQVSTMSAVSHSKRIVRPLSTRLIHAVSASMSCAYCSQVLSCSPLFCRHHAKKPAAISALCLRVSIVCVFIVLVAVCPGCLFRSNYAPKVRTFPELCKYVCTYYPNIC